MANTRQYNNVYDAMLAGFMKLCLVLGIAALTLSKFTGFEWCAPPCSSETARRSALLAPSRPTAQQPSDTRAAAAGCASSRTTWSPSWRCRASSSCSIC